MTAILKQNKYYAFRLNIYDEYHRGFQYKDGLNKLKQKFNPYGQCQGGGLYFFTSDKLTELMIRYMCNNDNYDDNREWFRKVTFPDDARIYMWKKENAKQINLFWAKDKK